MGVEIEALLMGYAGASAVTAGPGGTTLDYTTSLPLDVISPIKAGSGNYTIIKGAVIPNLVLESSVYRFGVRQNATQTHTLRGDSLYYTPGAPKYQSFSTSGVGPYSFSAGPAIVYVEQGVNRYALNVCLRNNTTGAYKRLFNVTDYTETSSGITLTATPDAVTYPVLQVVYASNSATIYSQSVHEGTSVKPAAVRGKDIDIYLSSPNQATPVVARWNGVQSFEVTRRVNLENDEEFGNERYISQDYDVPDLTGQIVLKPVDANDFYAKLVQVANVTTGQVIGPYTSIALQLEARISDPDTGTVLKTLYVSDARFTIPAMNGRVQQKYQMTFPFQSDSGVLKVYKGAR